MIVYKGCDNESKITINFKTTICLRNKKKENKFNMSLESAIHSIRELVPSGLAESFIIDTSAVGNKFANAHHKLDLRVKKAVFHELTSSALMDSFRSAESFIDFLGDYPNISTSEIVIGELNKRIQVLTTYIRAYSQGGKYQEEQSGQNLLSPEKGMAFLRRILIREVEAINTLKKRIESQDTSSLKFLEEAVIDTSLRSYAEEDRKDFNDEKIVAKAIYQAFNNKRPVAIITRDHRFKYIVQNVRNLFGGESYLKRLHNFLNGNLSVIIGEDGQYRVDYCYGDRPRLNLI